MRVYLAADSSLQAEMRELRGWLQERGFTVTSRWLDVELEHTGKVAYSELELAEWALKDLADVDSADIFVLYNPESKHRQGTGGRHIEFGYAFARGKTTIYCGEKKENIFHRLSSITITLFTEESVKDMRKLAKTIIHATSYLHGYRTSER